MNKQNNEHTVNNKHMRSAVLRVRIDLLLRRASLLVTRALLLVARSYYSRSKNATRGSWHRY